MDQEISYLRKKIKIMEYEDRGRLRSKSLGRISARISTKSHNGSVFGVSIGNNRKANPRFHLEKSMDDKLIVNADGGDAEDSVLGGDKENIVPNLFNQKAQIPNLTLNENVFKCINTDATDVDQNTDNENFKNDDKLLCKRSFLKGKPFKVTKTRKQKRQKIDGKTSPGAKSLNIPLMSGSKAQNKNLEVDLENFEVSNNGKKTVPPETIDLEAVDLDASDQDDVSMMSKLTKKTSLSKMRTRRNLRAGGMRSKRSNNQQMKSRSKTKGHNSYLKDYNSSIGVDNKRVKI